MGHFRKKLSTRPFFLPRFSARLADEVDASPPYFLQRPCAWPVLFAPAMVKSPRKIAGSRLWSNRPGLVMTGPETWYGSHGPNRNRRFTVLFFSW